NECHLEWVYHDLATNHQIFEFESAYFDQAYYSHVIGRRKPNEDIYQFVTNDAQIKPEETIFIDDLLPNILAAKDHGWQTYHHDPSDSIVEVIHKILMTSKS
ncbi:MAG: HAD-IA family hydrolase, partial [Saprospiraceae bacterium]